MKILVVDDSQFVQQYMSKILKTHFKDAQVYFAGTGEEGYELYHSVTPHLIITDLLMPGVDGKSLIKLIRHSDKDVKIIVLSADIQKTVKAEVEELGITLFLNKPLDTEKQNQLVDVIKNEMDSVSYQ